MTKLNKLNIILFFHQLFILILIIIIHKEKSINKKWLELSYNKKYNLVDQIKLDYENNIFLIITRDDCIACGLFSYFQICLGCINFYINQGFIPIIELKSFPNIFNSFNKTNVIDNPWEKFFNQPYGYRLDDVIKKAKHIKYIKCGRLGHSYPNTLNLYLNKVLIDFWHNIAKKYVQIKEEIIIEANIIIKNLFNDSKNILGVLMRGTDFLALKPKNHCKPPTSEMAINDIKKMNETYNYDFIFLATEDELIKDKFIKVFKNKLKYIYIKNKIEYDYKKKKFIALCKNIKGNIENMKIYLFNIIILSTCIDVIVSRTSGAIGVFVLSEGFRNAKVYYLGNY